jgi:cellulose synthase/poly-beta-1,6-N-acetylglucosamine synthase-like glycosyltransferase
VALHEIPHPGQRPVIYRLFEIFPGALTWTVLLAPLWLTLIDPLIAAIAIIVYILAWFMKGVSMNIRTIQTYKRMRKHQTLNWHRYIKELDEPQSALDRYADDRQALPFRWHYNNLVRRAAQLEPLKSEELFHAVIITLYNEPRDVLEPTVQSVIDSEYDLRRVILIIAYEERTGEPTEALASTMIEEYGQHFYHAVAVKHTVLPGEVKGKGGNITCSGRWLKQYLDKEGIAYDKVVVTTLDTDNRPDKKYLAALTYLYLACPDPRYASFQPIPMFLNNIWDAAAPMRVIATGNSIWNMVLAGRLHALRNFSSHAQGMQALVDTDFWSTRTIVEDGHQFWRTYFRYEGRHIVYPIYVPIFQDAVLTSSYKGTFKAQFLQIRRWAWGASDIAYIIYFGFFKKNKIPKFDLITKTFRIIEGHLSWATASLILAFAALIPVNIGRAAENSIITNQLPQIVSTIQNIALVGIFVTMFMSLVTLPPRPARYKRRRSILMMIQWVYLPLTTLLYNTLAALYSQTRLMLGWYIGEFNVTEKAVKKERS